MVQFPSDLAKWFVKLKSVCYLFQQTIDKKIKTWTRCFPPKATLRQKKGTVRLSNQYHQVMENFFSTTFLQQGISCILYAALSLANRVMKKLCSKQTWSIITIHYTQGKK